MTTDICYGDAHVTGGDVTLKSVQFIISRWGDWQ